MGAMCYKL